MLKFLILTCLLALWLAPSPAPAVAADPCPGTRPIAEVRKLPINSQATVRGFVTVPTGAFTDGKSFAVQDTASNGAASGIYVYRNKGIGQELAAGDEVCVTGKLAEYHGLLELLPATPAQVVRLGGGKPPQPQVIEPGKIGEATEGRLVSVTGPVSRLGDRRFRVGAAAIFLEKQAGISTAGLSEGCPATVIGLSAAYDGPQIWPRSQADVIPGDCAPVICEPLTISQIQGRGVISPFDGKTDLACLMGCVTGVTAEGFFLQSPEPDADPKTSEGIYAYRFSSWTNPRGLHPGDLVELRNFDIQEYYDQTEIVGLETDTDATYRVTGRCELPAAVVVPPLTDPAIDPTGVYEPFEGMRVALTFDGAVTGPTARYVSRYPAGDPEIALVDRGSPLYGQRIFAQEGTTAAVSSLPIGRGMVYLTGGTGVDLPDVGTGDRVSATDLTGVLAYQFGRYVLLVDDPAPIRVEDAPDAVDVEVEIGPKQFAVCTMNLENLFDAVDDGDGDLGRLGARRSGRIRGAVKQAGRGHPGGFARLHGHRRAGGRGQRCRVGGAGTGGRPGLPLRLLRERRRARHHRGRAVRRPPGHAASQRAGTDVHADGLPGGLHVCPRPACPAQSLRRRRLSAVRPSALPGRPDGAERDRRPGAGSTDSRQPPEIQTR